MPESSVKSGMLGFLRKYGGLWCNIHKSPYTTPAGVPDIVGCYRGAFVGIEVKTPRRYARLDHGQRPEQKGFEVALLANGGFYVLACTTDMVRQALGKIDDHLSALAHGGIPPGRP